MKTIVATPLDTLEDGTKVNYIMQEGTIGQEMFLITDGDGVVLESTNAAGQAEQIGSLGTGDFFGELAGDRALLDISPCIRMGYLTGRGVCIYHTI